MQAWLTHARRLIGAGRPVVLVTVARVLGSAPREPGAKMLVSATETALTIGGGHLEWKAMAHARECLTGASPARWLRTFPLGPALGQCCGGQVVLLFERLSDADHAWLASVEHYLSAGQACVRTVQISESASSDVGASAVSVARADASVADTAREESVTHAGECATHAEEGAADAAQALTVFQETLSPPALNIIVFGAGHVGRALVQVLALLPCRVTWVDGREEAFAQGVPESVHIEITDVPEDLVDQAPAGSCFLIMTHDHALDQRVCERVLRRDDFAYFGLIGSQTKRRKFEHRFRAKGIAPARYARMVCPIGEAGIAGKQPGVIAVAVAAQLLRMEAAPTPSASTLHTSVHALERAL